jgi:hypothetical protein
MIYKGKEIADRIYLSKEEMISELYENSQEFDLDDIEAWKEAIIKKTEELKSKGVGFKDVKLNIVGDGFHYNPYGADDEPYMNIHLQWQEWETDEVREKRIEKAKKKIDADLKYEIEREMWKKRLEEREVQEAIDRVQRAGYKVV